MVDLHIHSNFSDGTNTIEEIVDKIIEKQVDYFSITDHDTIDGILYLKNNTELMKKLEDNNIKFVSGIEFSSIVNGNKVHLLGYNYDPSGQSINDAVKLGWQKRQNKFQLRLDALKSQLGIEYSAKSIEEMKQCRFMGKPIMANYLVKDGKFNDRDEAIINAINKLIIPAYETRVDAGIIVPSIINSGGVCVWAHPLGGLNEPKISFEKVEEIVCGLLPLGLRGIECYYNLYTKDENEKLIKIAQKYNLLISAGSDYHGKNKYAEIGEVLDKTWYDVTDNCSIIKEIF